MTDLDRTSDELEPDDAGAARDANPAPEPERTEDEPLEADGAGRFTASAASSLALRDIPIPDYCDVVIVPTRGVDETDPRVWADAIFSHENTPLSRRGMLALRDEAVRMFDMVPPPLKEYEADEVVGGEALIKDDSENLRVRIGVAVLPGGALLQVTTAVKFRSVRGRIAFAPRRIMHASGINTLARRAPATLRRREMTADGVPRRSLPGQVARKALGRGASTAR